MFVRLFRVFLIVELVVDSRQAHLDPSKPAFRFVVPGFSSFSKKLAPTMEELAGASGGLSRLEKDLELYNQKASDFTTKLLGEAMGKAQEDGTAEIVLPDPLSFWFVQVLDQFLSLCLLDYFA